MSNNSRNVETLTDFVKYCEAHPEQRFWQALRNWNQLNHPEQSFILTCDIVQGEVKFFDHLEDTFFRENY